MQFFSVQDIFAATSAFLAIVTALAGIWATIRQGLFSAFKVGSLEIEGSITAEQVKDLESAKRDKPFESVALANYYNHALSRATISFWFSLIFASIGFGVIIFAFATHNSQDIWSTVIKASSGAVIDTVSSLFFFQSTSAQKSMGEFFEKLRLDRLNAEARELISEIESSDTRDQLRSQLVLKYSGIEKLLTGGSPS